jgi:hypothetical protein
MCVDDRALPRKGLRHGATSSASDTSAFTLVPDPFTLARTHLFVLPMVIMTAAQIAAGSSAPTVAPPLAARQVLSASDLAT